MRPGEERWRRRSVGPGRRVQPLGDARGRFGFVPLAASRGINVKFRDEHGAGAAVRREYMSLVAESACDRSNLLFASHDGGATMHPNPVSGAVSERHLEYFAALGRLSAMALYHGETFPLRLTPAFCDRILGVPMRLDHLESVDPTLYKNQVRYVLDRGPEGLDLTWRDVADPTGVFSPGELAPLRDRDPDAEVTREDAPGYLRALVERRVVGSVRRQTASFAAGFGAVIPTPLLSRMRGLLDGRELSELIAGARTVDLDDWRRHTAYSDAAFSQTFTVWCFWRAMETFAAEERVAVLQFATGLSSAPAGGFPKPRGVHGRRRAVHAGRVDVAEVRRTKARCPWRTRVSTCCGCRGSPRTRFRRGSRDARRARARWRGECASPSKTACAGLTISDDAPRSTETDDNGEKHGTGEEDGG